MHGPAKVKIFFVLYNVNGPGNSVGIATELRAGRSGDRVPVEAGFSARVQTGHGAHQASCTMGTGSFPEVKSGQGVMLTTHPLLVPWSRKGRVIPLLSLWAVRPVQRLYNVSGPGSSVGIATELRAGRSGNRVPVEAKFSARVQTGHGAHQASCTMGTGSFPEVKSGQGVTLTTHPF
jgi:hypothetical protein